MEPRYLYWFDELSEDHIPIVGRKCAGLGIMRGLSMPVPPGFALTVDAYNTFMEESGTLHEITAHLRTYPEGLKGMAEIREASDAIRLMVESKRMPEALEKTVVSAYRSLCEECGTENVAVSVRSAGPKSRPGQYETYLNVSGEDDVVEKVMKVWGSTFVPRAVAARVREGLPIETDPIGVAVVKMVNARAAGVCFTAEPCSGNLSEILVEASWGLGESVVGGVTNPDSFVVDKDSLEIKSRKIGHKPLKVVYGAKGTTEQETSQDEADAPCVSEDEVREIARLAKDLESKLGKPQDTEWAVEDGTGACRFFLLQTRPIVMAKKADPIDRILDRMSNLVK
jgi:pyruvate,water dikinase